ncbi:unnamed protein product [Sphagnum jensenii]
MCTLQRNCSQGCMACETSNACNDNHLTILDLVHTSAGLLQPFALISSTSLHQPSPSYCAAAATAAHSISSRWSS